MFLFRKSSSLYFPKNLQRVRTQHLFWQVKASIQFRYQGISDGHKHIAHTNSSGRILLITLNLDCLSVSNKILVSSTIFSRKGKMVLTSVRVNTWEQVLYNVQVIFHPVPLLHGTRCFPFQLKRKSVPEPKDFTDDDTRHTQEEAKRTRRFVQI